MTPDPDPVAVVAATQQAIVTLTAVRNAAVLDAVAAGRTYAEIAAATPHLTPNAVRYVHRPRSTQTRAVR